MNALRPTHLLRASRTLPRPIPRHLHRTYATEPPSPHPPSTPPNPTSSKPPSRVGSFYRTFSYPLLKTFLGALFTYQLAYYVWLKLEVVEEKLESRNAVQELKGELKDAVAEQRVKAKGVLEEVETKAESVKEEVRKKGWWP